MARRSNSCRAAAPNMGLEAGANFFSRELPVSDAAPGRLYVGVCAPGRRLKPALIRVYVAALAAGQTLYEKYGEAAAAARGGGADLAQVRHRDTRSAGADEGQVPTVRAAGAEAAD